MGNITTMVMHVVVTVGFVTQCFGYTDIYDDRNQQQNIQQYRMLNRGFDFGFGYGALWSQLDNYHLTPKQTFLNNPFNQSVIHVEQMNNKWETFAQQNIAQDITVAAYTGYTIATDNPWMSFSTMNNRYEGMFFDKVKMHGDMYTQFDMQTEREGWRVRESVRNIVYGGNNCVKSFSVTSNDRFGSTVKQQVGNIEYTASKDQGRYSTLLAEYRQKTSEPNMYGFNDVVTALEQSIEPPKYCAEKFSITIETGRAEKTRMNFSNVTWKNDRVVGFDVIVSVGKQQTQMRVTPICLDNGAQGGITVEVKNLKDTTPQTYTWKYEDRDTISFNDFSKQVMQGVNPLQIVGSSQLQIGDGKTAFLAITYDKQGSLTGNHSRAIVYGITKEPTAHNALKREIRELEKTAPSIVKDALWTTDIRKLDEKQLAMVRDDIRAHLEHEVKEYRFQDATTFKTTWGDTLKPDGKALLQVEGSRVVNEGSFATQNGKYVHDLVFVLTPKPVAVSGTIDGKKVGVEQYFEKPQRVNFTNLVDMKNISNVRDGSTLRSDIKDAQGMLTITTENKVATKVDAQWNIDANAFTAMRNTDGKNVIVYKEKDRPVGIIPCMTTTFSDDEKRALDEKHIKIITTPDEFKQVIRENVVFVVVNGIRNENTKQSNQTSDGMQQTMSDIKQKAETRNTQPVGLYYKWAVQAALEKTTNDVEQKAKRDGNFFDKLTLVPLKTACTVIDVVKGSYDVSKVGLEMALPVSISRGDVQKLTMDCIKTRQQQGTLGSAVSVVYLAHSGGGQPTLEAMETMPFHSNYVVLLDCPILEPKINNAVHVEHLKTTWIGNMSVTITPSETYHVVNTWNGSPSTRNHDMTLKENKQLINKALEEMYKRSVEFRVDKLSYQKW